MAALVTNDVTEIIMDFATLIVSVAVPVTAVLLALVIHAPLSALIWRQFLRLSDQVARR
jgi:hypothetical protein